MEKETPPKLAKFYSPLAAILITILIYFAAQLLSGVIISIIPLVLHWTSQQTITWISNNTAGQFLFILIAETITLSMLWQFLKKRRANFVDIGFNKPRIQHVAYALAGFILYIVLYVVGLAIVTRIIPGLNVDQKQELGFNAATHGLDLGLVFVSLVILPPIVEEIVVRGFLYTNLRAKLSINLSALIASTLFAAAHLSEGGSGGLLWVAAIDTFILSLVLCYLRERTNSLWPSIGVHMIKNGLAFVILFNIVHFI